jgi:site-specific DNA recombinase
MRSVCSGGARRVVDVGDDDRDARRRLRPTDLKALVQPIEVGSAEIQISGAILKLLQTVAEFGGGSGVEPRANGVRGSIPSWLPGLNETANFVLPIPLHATPEPSIKVRKRHRDRVERIRLAEGSKPSLRERAAALALEIEVVRTKDLTDIGIPRCYLARMCNEGLLVKVGYGRYRAAVPKSSLVRDTNAS